MVLWYHVPLNRDSWSFERTPVAKAGKLEILTLTPAIMEVENYRMLKVTHLGGEPFSTSMIIVGGRVILFRKRWNKIQVLLGFKF